MRLIVRAAGLVLLAVCMWSLVASIMFLTRAHLWSAIPHPLIPVAWWAYLLADFSGYGAGAQAKLRAMLSLSAIVATVGTGFLCLGIVAALYRPKGRQRPLYGETAWVEQDEAKRRGFSFSRRL